MAKILIMDDEPGLRNVTFTMLKPTGHSLFLAEDGKQAIEIAKKEKPDLALLDMRVPDMDGLEVLAELKKMDPTVQCIMLSGFGDVETAVGAIKKGAFDYLSKPFKVQEVLEVVNKALAAKTKSPQTTPAQPSDAKSGPQINLPSSYTPPAISKSLIIGGAIAGVILIGIVISLLITKSSGTTTIYNTTYQNPTSLVFDGKNLWVSDWVSRSIYKHIPDKSLSIENVVSFPDHSPIGIAWDGKHLWSCDSNTSIIMRHLPNQQLTQIFAFKIAAQPTAIGSDGTNLFLADNNGKLYTFKILSEGVAPESTFTIPAQQPSAIFYMDNNIWIADSETGKIYKHNPANFTLEGVYAIKYYLKNSGEKFSSITYDGKNLWTSQDGKSRILKHNKSELISSK